MNSPGETLFSLKRAPYLHLFTGSVHFSVSNLSASSTCFFNRFVSATSPMYSACQQKSLQTLDEIPCYLPLPPLPLRPYSLQQKRRDGRTDGVHSSWRTSYISTTKYARSSLHFGPRCAGVLDAEAALRKGHASSTDDDSYHSSGHCNTK